MIPRRWVPSLLWTVVIFTLTSIPDPDAGGIQIGGLDKAIHASLYAVLAVLSARGARAWQPGDRVPRWPVVLRILGAIVLVAAVDEWHQQFIPGRSPELLDWLADAVGTVGGLAAFALTRRRLTAHAR